MVKPGYKKSEIGVIPEDWETRTLKDAFLRLDAGVSVNSDESSSSDYFVLKTSAVRNGVVDLTEAKPVIHSDYSRLKCPVKKGSIIISRMNTPAMVGECGFSAKDAPKIFLPDRLWQVEPRSVEYDFQWLNYLLNTEKYSRAVRATATGTSNSMKNIAKDRLLEITIPKPPLPEQQRIAKALSDMDELIVSLEKMLAKKKAIKQGVMQELLTGKRRLPGFRGEWTESALSALCTNITDGSHDSPEESRNGYYMPSVKDMTSLGFDYSTCKQISKSDYERLVNNGCKPRSGDVLIAKDGSILKYSFVYEEYLPTVILSSIAIIRPNISLIDSHFLAQYFQQSEFVDNVILNYKTGTGVPRIVLENFKKIQIVFPASIDEQKAISSLLMELDEEIECLKNKLSKISIIKQGMMQQLLTGAIRLV